jgi:hypothetical protein
MRFFRRRAPDLRCSFCNKSQRDVLKLVSGPHAYICNECVSICADLVKPDESLHLERARAAGSTSNCTCCGREAAATELLMVPHRGPICYVCVAAIKVAAGPAWEFRAEQDPPV